MLLYHNARNRRQVLQLLGSMVFRWRPFVVGFVVASITFALQILQDSDIRYRFTVAHQYPHQVLGGIVTIALVFRINQAWSRYWEAITNLHFMYSKWADAFSQFCAFISVTIQKAREKAGVPEDMRGKIELLEDMRDKVENDFLLLSAMACDRICRGDCAQMERRHEIGIAWDKQVVLREDLRKGEDVTDTKGMPKFKVSRCSRTDILNDEKLDDVEMGSLWNAEYVVQKPPKQAKYNLLQVSSDRCNMVVNWLNYNLAYCATMMDTPAPIQSRMYQEISNGMLGFNNVMKIADVPFAFPFDQMILVLLFAWTICVPFYVMSFTESLIAGPFLAFLLTVFMFALNDTARELENPFGLTPNKICVPEFHSRFALVVRDAMRSCQHPPRPPKAKNNKDDNKDWLNSPRWTTVSQNTSPADMKEEGKQEKSGLQETEAVPVGASRTEPIVAGMSTRSSTQLSPRLSNVTRQNSRVSFQDSVSKKDDVDASTKMSIVRETMLQDDFGTLPPQAKQPLHEQCQALEELNQSTSDSTGLKIMFQQLAEMSDSVERHLRDFSCQLKHISTSGVDQSIASRRSFEAGQSCSHTVRYL